MAEKVISENKSIPNNSYCEYFKQVIENRDESYKDINVLKIRIFDRKVNNKTLFTNSPWDIKYFDKIIIQVDLNSSMIKSDERFNPDGTENYNKSQQRDANIYEVYTININTIHRIYDVKNLTVIGDGSKYKTKIRFNYDTNRFKLLKRIKFLRCMFKDGFVSKIKKDIYVELNECIIYYGIKILFSNKPGIVIVETSKIIAGYFLNISNTLNTKFTGVVLEKTNNPNIQPYQFDIAFHKNELLELMMVEFNHFPSPLKVSGCKDVNMISVTGIRPVSNYSDTSIYVNGGENVTIVNTNLVNINVEKSQNVTISGIYIKKEQFFNAKLLAKIEDCTGNIACTDCGTGVGTLKSGLVLKNNKNDINISECTFNKTPNPIVIEETSGNIEITDCNFFENKRAINVIDHSDRIAIQSCTFSKCKTVLNTYLAKDVELSELEIMGYSEKKPSIIKLHTGISLNIEGIKIIDCILNINTYEDGVLENNEFSKSDVLLNYINKLEYNENEYLHTVRKGKFNIISENLSIENNTYANAIPNIRGCKTLSVIKNTFTNGLNLEYCNILDFGEFKENIIGDELKKDIKLLFKMCENIDIYENTFNSTNNPPLFLLYCKSCNVFENLFIINSKPTTIIDEEGERNFYLIDKSREDEMFFKVKSKTNMMSDMISTFAWTKKKEFGSNALSIEKDNIDRYNTKNVVCLLDTSEDWAVGFIKSVKQYLRYTSIGKQL